jgi:two-component SAPR family response regulator
VAVRCLGSFDVSIGGKSVDGWRSGKARALFEYLVTHRGRPTSRDALIQALWPDPDALASGTSLKVAVHALRQMISSLVAGNPGVSLGIVVRECTYELQSPGVWLDVEEFERCCKLASQLEAYGRTREALAVYERAADLYRGDFLVDNWDEWVVFRREGLKDQYMFVLARLADAALQAGHYERCIELCRQLLEQDCCREDTFRMLMLCHAQLGQRGRVQRWHDLCVQTLRGALDTEPEEETEQIFRWATGPRGRSLPIAVEYHNGHTSAINPLLTAT